MVKTPLILKKCACRRAVVGIVKVTLLILATTLLPLPALQVGHGLIPSPTVNKRWWSIVNGTLAGYFLEFKLLRAFVKALAICVAFWGVGLVLVVRDEAIVPV